MYSLKKKKKHIPDRCMQIVDIGYRWDEITKIDPKY